jgi:hypothetical protein
VTYATASLLECREVLQEYTDLTDDELGIVGDESHNGGYHQGWDLRRIVDGVLKDYSWQESARDWNHKTNAARAFDVGMFGRLREMSVWIVQQCELGAPDTLDLRSVIYSPDGVEVLRWDRLGLHSGGDSGHLLHTHFSWFADAEFNNKAGLFRRFFEGGHMAGTPFLAETSPFDHGKNLAFNAAAIANLDPKFTGGNFQGSEVAFTTAFRKLIADVESLQLGGITPEQLQAAVKGAIQDPAVLAAIANAVNEDEARRLKE